MTCVVDTSWLAALLMDGDEHHARAVSEAQVEDAIHVPPAVLVETLGTLRQKAKAERRKGGEASHATSMRALEMLAAKPNMLLGSPPHDHVHAVRILRAHPRLSYVDAVVVAAAHGKDLPLRTFDREQAKAHGKP